MSQFFLSADICINIDPQETLFSVANVSIINSMTPEDAFEQLAYTSQEYVRVTIFAQTDPFFIDTEGTIEFCRLCADQEKKIIPVLPVDYGAVMRAQQLHVAAAEIELTHPLFEKGITRPAIIKKIFQDLSIPILAGGVFSTEEQEQLYQWGCDAVVHYQNNRATVV